MKKILLLSAILIFIAACDNKESAKSTGTTVKTPEATVKTNAPQEPAKASENKPADAKTTVETGRETNVKTDNVEVKDGKIKAKNTEIDVKGGSIKAPGVSIKY